MSDFVYTKLGLTTAATINDESPYADGLAAAFRANFEAAGGTITAVEAINSADTDFKPLLTSIAQGNPEALYFPDFNPACALIAKQAAEIMPDTLLIGSDGCLATDFLETAGAAANGVFASSPDLSVFANGDFYKNEFLPAYKEQFGTDPTSVFHAHAFDAMNILFEAIKSRGDRERRRLPDDPASGAARRDLRDERLRRASPARSPATSSVTAPPTSRSASSRRRAGPSRAARATRTRSSARPRRWTTSSKGRRQQKIRAHESRG